MADDADVAETSELGGGYLVKFDAMEWESPVTGLRHKVRRVGARQLRLVEYSKAMALHWCEREHVGQILDGQLAIESASGTQIVKAGDALFIPAGPAHAHRVTPLTLVVTALFAEDVEEPT